MIWKIATVVLAVVAVGLGIWAFSLQSDIEDKDAQIAAQQQELNEQGDIAGQVQDAASGAAADAQEALSDIRRGARAGPGHGDCHGGRGAGGDRAGRAGRDRRKGKRG